MDTPPCSSSLSAAIDFFFLSARNSKKNPSIPQKGMSEERTMWSELPFDLLVIISEALPMLDFASFSLVCRSWHHVFTYAKYNRFEAPWLMFSGGKLEPRTANFYALSSRKQIKIHNPPGLSFHNRLCIGSAHGWLITADVKSELSLVNPITKQQIDLPPVSSFDHLTPVYDLNGHISNYIYGKEGYERTYTAEQIRHGFYVKATLTHSPNLVDDYTVVIILYQIDCVAFARRGDKKWTTLACLNLRKDISSHNGTIYTIISSGVVESWDFNQKHGFPEQPVTYVPEDKRITDTHIPYFFYLVPTPWGDMLHVRRRRKEDKPYLTKRIMVFRIDPETKKLIRVKSIGDYAIFIGGCQPICISCKLNQNLKCNSVYYTDEGFQMIHRSKETTRDIGIYHLEDESIERMFEHPLLKWPPPIWFQPSLV